jgi:predicted RNase H-like nuclease (RuvC/YqgF family)
METKKCQECGNEYESKSISGHEQKYCSSSCRNKAANKRRENNLFEKFKGTIQQPTIIGNAERQNESRIIEKNSTDYGKNYGLSFDRIFELVSTNANLSAENKRLEEKIKNVEIEKQNLEMEFDELESKLQENENNGSMISGVNNLVDKVSPFIPFIYQMFTKPKNENNAQTKTA